MLYSTVYAAQYSTVDVPYYCTKWQYLSAKCNLFVEMFMKWKVSQIPVSFLTIPSLHKAFHMVIKHMVLKHYNTIIRCG